jgi:hypothetical protein
MTTDTGGVHAATGDAGGGPGAGGDGRLRPGRAHGGAARVLLSPQGGLRLQRGRGAVLRRDPQPFVWMRLRALGLALAAVLAAAGCGDGGAGQDGTGGSGAAMAGSGGAPSGTGGGTQAGTGGAAPGSGGNSGGGGGQAGTGGVGGGPVFYPSCMQFNEDITETGRCSQYVTPTMTLYGYKGFYACLQCTLHKQETPDCRPPAANSLCVRSCSECEFR